MELAADLYNDLVEFLEDQQDADCNGDPPQYVPNKAMQLLMRLQGTTQSAERVAQDAAKRVGTSHREMSPSPNNTKTPYGLALDLAFDIVQRDDKDNESPKRSLRPGLTDEYTLAKHFLIAQEYISVLRGDLEEAKNKLTPQNTAPNEVLLARARDLLYQTQGHLDWIGITNVDLLRQQIKTFLEYTIQPPQVLAECEECERIIVSPLRRFDR